MLAKLLNSPQRPWQQNYKYLPVSTSLEQQLQREAKALLAPRKAAAPAHVFVGNEGALDEELILLKLKGYIDPKDVSSKATEHNKISAAVQVGTLIEGEPFKANRVRNKKTSIVDYFLELDRKTAFTRRKFSEIQKLAQRKKVIKKKIMKKKRNAK